MDAADLAAALRQFAAGVALLTVRDDMDDVGTTVTSVMSVSAQPALVAVGLSTGGYPREVLEAVGSCGLSVLAAGQTILASRFSSAGRPGARHLLETVPWTRGEVSGAILLTGALTGLDCRVHEVVEAGDHVIAVLSVEGVPVLDPAGVPLLRLRGRYTEPGGIV